MCDKNHDTVDTLSARILPSEEHSAAAKIFIFRLKLYLKEISKI